MKLYALLSRLNRIPDMMISEEAGSPFIRQSPQQDAAAGCNYILEIEIFRIGSGSSVFIHTVD